MRVATICARQGSKGLPNKNALLFRGQPLISHAVASAREADVFDVVVVSSDSSELRALGLAAGADIAVDRPAELASDHASKLDAIRHAVEVCERQRGALSEVIADIAVTSPLRAVSDIRDAVALLQEPGVNRVLSASPARHSPFFDQVMLDHEGRPRLPCEGDPIVRRQDSPPIFDLSGAVYVWRRHALFGPGPLVQSDTRLYVMPPERSCDIDDDFDLVIAKAMADGATSLASDASPLVG